MLSTVKPDDELIAKYARSYKDIKTNFLLQTDGIERSILMYILTCNLFNNHPVTADPLYWPFQYIEDKGDEQRLFSPDYFTEKALTLIQKSTARETLGLTFKDVMEMDYGMYQYLEKLLQDLEEVRKKALEDLENNTREKDG